MPATTDVGSVEMRIAKVARFGPPLAEEPSHCVVLDEVSGDRHLAIWIGEGEAFSLAARLQGLEFGRPMTYDFAAALVRCLGGHVRQVRVDRLVEAYTPRRSRSRARLERSLLTRAPAMR
jgi:bifunctional DNase/RNase